MCAIHHRSNTSSGGGWTSIVAAIAALTLSACGGGDAVAPVPPATLAAAAPASTSMASTLDESAQRQSPAMATPLGSTTSAALPAVSPQPSLTGVIDDTQRAVLDAAVRALQATLTVALTDRGRVQSVVNDLAHALACVRAHFRNGDEMWRILERRQFDTWWRRLRQALFAATAALLAQQPRDAVCTIAAPPAGDDGDAGAGAGSGSTPPSPTAGEPLRDELARLERLGVLPALDRGRDLRGPDVNDNGVRDDVEAYIDALPLTDAQRKAAMQTARVQQRSMLIDLTDRPTVVALGDASMAATKCMAIAFEGSATDWGGDLSLKIEAITANTPEQARRYIQYMRALSGTSTRYPRENTCEE